MPCDILGKCREWKAVKLKKDYLKKLKLKRNKKYIYLVLPVLVVLFISIFFAYSKFYVFKDTEVVKSTVGNFVSGDAVIGAYIDNKYSSTIPSKDAGYVVSKIVCDNDAVGKWDDNKWGLLITNLTKRTKCNVYFKTYSNADAMNDLIKQNGASVSSDDEDNNVRFTGADPSNYVYFNCSDYNNQTSDTCEIWRIIGTFNNVTKSDGTKESLVKIIKEDRLNNDLFRRDYKKNGVGGSTSNKGSNDWTTSQLMMMLNPTDYLSHNYTNSNDIIYLGSQQVYSKMGSYYYGTKGCRPAEAASGSSFTCTEVDFTNTGLKNDATRNAIETVIWNLGGNDNYNTATASMFYASEKEGKGYTNHPGTWTGKIGLIYASDYGYATSGGSTTSRSECLNKELFNWDNTDVSNCKDNDYLFKADYPQWIIDPRINYDTYVYFINSTGHLRSFGNYNEYAVRPSLYLKSSIKITSGNGSKTNPYQLKI